MSELLRDPQGDVMHREWSLDGDCPCNACKSVHCFNPFVCRTFMDWVLFEKGEENDNEHQTGN